MLFRDVEIWEGSCALHQHQHTESSVRARPFGAAPCHKDAAALPTVAEREASWAVADRAREASASEWLGSPAKGRVDPVHPGPARTRKAGMASSDVVLQTRGATGRGRARIAFFPQGPPPSSDTLRLREDSRGKLKASYKPGEREMKCVPRARVFCAA